MKIKGLEKLREQSDEGITRTIFRPDGEPYLAADGTEATMTVVGSESKRYRDAKLAQQRRLMKRARTGARDLTPEELEENVLKQAAAAVIGWHGWEDDKGECHPCEEKYLVQVLAYDHIFDQVQSMIQGHAAFFANDSGS
jgi:hypothetical protein